jgi:ornithine cyclodeaminase/alanine dehydrogenase-like protein (mu-crystallin family)
MKLPIRYLSSEDIARALPMNQAIEAMKGAFAELSSNRALVPSRLNLGIPEANGEALIMPAYSLSTERIGLKFLSLFRDNPGQGLPLIQALVILMDATNGRPLALLDGSSLTALRTGAASGAATDILAPKEAKTVTIFGAGVQGRTQLEAVCAVRAIDQAYICDSLLKAAGEFVQEMSAQLTIPVEVVEPAEGVGSADIICTATTSSEPVFADQDLKTGAHINAVGAYKPDEREIPSETVQRAKVVVDHRESCWSEAGELIIPLEQGLIAKDHIHGELGSIIAGEQAGRESAEEITLFKSVGNAIQDLFAASHALEAAEQQDLGTLVRI